MNISINQITPRRDGGEIVAVIVHFTARTVDGSINLSGSVPVEDFADKINFEGLEDEVRQELIDRIMNGTLGAE